MGVVLELLRKCIGQARERPVVGKFEILKGRVQDAPLLILLLRARALTDLRLLPSDGWESCARIVEAACSASKASEPASPGNPNWDAMAVSFASIANGLTWGSIFLAFLAVVVGIAWGHIIVSRAEKEAREAAEKCAKECANQWMMANAPDIIAQHFELLHGARAVNGDGDGDAADKMGEGAG